MARRKKKQGGGAAGWWLLLLFFGIVLLIWWVRRPDPAPTATAAPPPEGGTFEVRPSAGGGPIIYEGYDFTRAPGFAYPAPLPELQVVRYSGFTLAYAEPYEQAAWVAYQLTDDEVAGRVKRTDNFRADRQVRTGSATLEDYHSSGYDRGHLVPAGDMKWSRRAMEESFLLSNVSPQAPAFNRGIWNQLEQQTRRWAERDGALYVVTGPLLEPGLKTIGESRVAVPRYFFKVLLDARPPELKAIAFLMPNRGSKKALSAFVVSVDEVERRAGLDLFPQLPDEIEEVLEAQPAAAGWF
ncbi:MAG: DNA/RNA non-specific endonuclease [Catalinimonas sp.]